MKRGGHRRFGHGKCDAIDGPEIETFVGGVLFGEEHVDGFVGVGGGGPGGGEAEVVPLEGGRGSPEGLGLLIGVFDDDAHAVVAVVVGEIAENPDAGMIHGDEGGDALGRAEPEDRNLGAGGDGVAVESDDFEGVTGEGEAANFCGAAVEDVEEQAFAGFDSDGIAVAEHAAIDGEGVVADFETVRHAFGKRSFHGGFANGLERFVARIGSEEVHVHIAATAEGRLEFLEGEKDFAVVIAGRRNGFDVNGADLAGILAGREIRASAIVGVIEAETRGIGSEVEAAQAVGGDVGSAFFGGAVHVDRNELAVPVELLGRVGVVEDVDGDRLALLEAEEGAGELAVIGDSRDDALGGDFDGGGLDAEGVVSGGLRLRRGEGKRATGRRERESCDEAGGSKEITAR